jgi:TatD DNase family protein
MQLFDSHFFDSHCHFDFADFDQDREQVWRDCNERGIQHLMIPGVAPEQWQAAADIAGQYKNIVIGVGLHPHWVQKDLAIDSHEDYLFQLKAQLKNNIHQQECVAIGECGLDSFIETSMDLQQHVLVVHLQLAQEIRLPLIIHCRKAHNELFALLQEYDLPAGGVIHAFSGSYELAARYWAMGFRLGIGGTITYGRAQKTRTAVKQLPLDAILLETDAPDMPLSGKQGERNSPVNIIEVAKALADLRGETLATIATQTTRNAQTLFKITP